MITRLKLTLEQHEYSALLKIARAELRNPADQVHHLLRQELFRLGLLKVNEAEKKVVQTETTKQEESNANSLMLKK